MPTTMMPLPSRRVKAPHHTTDISQRLIKKPNAVKQAL